MQRELLTQIGLTDREAEVYKLLLRLGESSVAEIHKATGAHTQLLYRAIDGLVEKGLAHVTIYKHKKYVRAEDPIVLEKLAEQRHREIRAIVPDLRSAQKQSKDAIVQVAKGTEAIRAARVRAIDELPKGETLYIMGGGGGGQYYQVMKGLHTETETKRKKKKIKRLMISYDNQRSLHGRPGELDELSEFRYISDDLPTPTSYFLYGDTVAILFWPPEPMVITIQSQRLAQSYRQNFDHLWNIAKP